MSELINPIGFNDQKIEDIREQVKAKSDDIPYLLMPVKIETRFMKVDRPILGRDTFAEVLDTLFAIDDSLIFDPNKLPSKEVLGKLRKTNQQIDGTMEGLSGLKGISGNDKDLLLSSMAQVVKNHRALTKSLSRVRWGNTTEMKQLRTLRNQMDSKIASLSNGINQLKTKDSNKFDTDTFLKTLNTINKSMSGMATNKLSTADRKEKREVFSEVENQFASIEESIIESKQFTRINLRATKQQINLLNKTEAQWAKLLPGVKKNINTIKSRYKKEEYKLRLSELQSKIGSLKATIDTQLKPKMDLMLNLKIFSARTLLSSINQLRYKLKRQNKKRFHEFNEITNSSNKLLIQLRTLKANAFKVIEGNEEEFEVIKKAWNATDAELNRYIQRMKTFKGVGNQKQEVLKIVRRINNNFRSDLSGLKSRSKSNFSSLTNSAVEKSARALNESLNTLKDIQHEIKENIDKPNSRKYKTAVKKLTDFQKSYKKKSADLNIVPQKYYNEINRIIVDIKSTMEPVVNSTDTMNMLPDSTKNANKRAFAAVNSLRSAVKLQPTDALNRISRTKEASRSAIVFATKSITRDELWVRIYPDDIAIHTHEDALTVDEVDAGKAYWKEIWAASDDYETKLAAWRSISTSYGSQRAAWIVKSLEAVPSKSKDIIKKLQGKSKLVTTINKDLTSIYNLLSGAKDTNDQIEKLGQSFSVVNSIQESLAGIKSGHEQLLMKSQTILLKVQSQVNAIIRNIQKTNGDGTVGQRQLQVVKQFVGAFNKMINTFKGVKRVKPTDLLDRESEKDVFPEVKIKEHSWTKAPHSKVMPDRFVVLLKDRSGNYKHLAASEPLPPDQLIVGLNPENFDADTFEYDEDGNLLVDESIKWLTDFEEARKIGMAVYINLDEQDLEDGFDKVFVLGVKDTTPVVGKNLVEQLIDNHHYIPEGASFLPVRTPTNNTEAGESGYRTFEEDAGLSFKIERNDEKELEDNSDPEFPTDAQRLSEGLGIDVDVLNNLDYHDRTEVSEALVFNKAMFHGTLGNYMEEGLDTLFTLDNIDHTKTFFSENVSARGILSSIRIGTQPYGILPTTAFSKFHITADDSFMPQLDKDDFDNTAVIQDDLQTRFDIRLKLLLNYLDTLWTSIRNNHVLYAGNTNPDDPQAHFMEMLGLQPNSSELYYRYGLNIASRQSEDEAADFSINFSAEDPWGPTNVANIFKGIVFSGYYFKSDTFVDEQDEELKTKNPLDYLNSKNSRISNQFTKARVFATRHLAEQSILLGNMVDGRELSEDLVAATNATDGSAEDQLNAQAELQYFIDWLVDENPWDVHAENKFAEVVEGSLTSGMPSRSLLFLMLRHAILSANADTILKILEFEGLTDQETRKKMGQPAHFYNRFGSGFNYVTKWTYLFSKINLLNNVLNFDMDEDNSFYTYMNSLSGTSNGFLNRYISPKHTFVFNNYSNHHLHQPFKDSLDETRETIRKLKDIPTARLEQLLVEHIDLCTYRLDAWRLGMVNKRLKEQRTANNTGIHIGAYGWVEDLKKGGARPLAKNIPGGLWKSGDGPIYEDEDNQGYIHTPSLNHAITAAILRAGFDANSGIAEIDNQMAINLSSTRVRIALNLLNGIRNGQDAGALLGYQFERGLHERYLHLSLELDEYIYDFREEFPLSVAVDDSVSLGEAALNNVVNGMELLELAQDFIESKGGPPNPGDSVYQSLKVFENNWWNHVNNANLKSATTAEKDAMLKEIDRMADAFDALGDLCISESVYQVARGNHVRASSIMDKLSRGDVPTEIEIANTPRTGTVVTHKTCLLFSPVSGIDHELSETGDKSVPLEGGDLAAAVVAVNARPANWNSAFTPRAIAEPTLNKWAGEMIGNPVKIKCQVEYTINDTFVTVTVSLADLEIQPLDALHLFGTGPLDGGAELNARIAMKVKNSIALPADFEGSADDIEIKIKYTERGAAWLDDEYSFYEKTGYLQSLRKLMTDSAILAADSLLIPGEEEIEENQIRNQQVDECIIRIENIKARLQILHDEFLDFFENEISIEDAPEHTFTDLQVDKLRELLLNASRFGVPGTIPEFLFDFGNEIGMSLLAAADGADKAIGKRLAQSEKEMALATDDTKSNDVRIGATMEVSKKLLGKAFVLLPHFDLRNGNEISDQLVLDASKGLLRNAKPMAMENWSHGLGRVRERMAGLETVQMWAENFEKDFHEKAPVQFPFQLDETGTSVDHWLGIEFPEGYEPAEDKLSIILMNSNEISDDPGSTKAGMLIDEWVEIIPNLSETTGVAFNYDQPDAKPANNLLLVVTPQVTGKWSWDDLAYTLDDTLELAKNRAVEPEHLEETVFGQILPGIMTEIVPPQLLPEGGDDSGDAQDNPLGLQVVTDYGVVNSTLEEDSEE